MESELFNSVNNNLMGTVDSNRAHFEVKDKTIVFLSGFILVSLFLHGLLLYFLKFQQNVSFETDPFYFEVRLQPNKVESMPLPANPVLETKQIKKKSAATPLAAKATSTLSTYDLLQQSERVIEQQLEQQQLSTKQLQFGSAHRDERSITPDWMKAGEEHHQGRFMIEDFQLADGGNFVKLTFSNGKTFCYNVRAADPADVFSVEIWSVQRCKG